MMVVVLTVIVESSIGKICNPTRRDVQFHNVKVKLHRTTLYEKIPGKILKKDIDYFILTH